MQLIISKWLAITLSIIWLVGAVIPNLLDYLNNRQIAALEAAKICYANDLKANPECGKWLRKIK